MGLLGDFAVGAAQAGEKIGLAQIQADIEENKRMRLAEFQDQLNIKSDARQEEAVVRRENRGLLAAKNTRAEVNAENLTQRQAQFDQDNNHNNVQKSIGTATSKARAAGDIGREEDTKNLLNKASPQNLSAAQKIAAATRAPERITASERRESQKEKNSDREIEAARKFLHGMTRDEVQKKINKTIRVKDDLGKVAIEDNPDYDPIIADKYDKANRQLALTDDAQYDAHTTKQAATAKQSTKTAITPRSEYDKLPVGASYIGPDGNRYTKRK